jgi:hypothetical protein
MSRRASIFPFRSTRYKTALLKVCSCNFSSDNSGVATVTVLVNTGSDVPIRIDAIRRFAAPRSSPSRVIPGFSSRDLIVTATGSVGAGEPAMIKRAPVQGRGSVRLSSTTTRRNCHFPSGNWTRSLAAPLPMLKTGSPEVSVRQFF